MTYRLLSTLSVAFLLGATAPLQAQDPEEPESPRRPRVRAPRVVIPRYNPHFEHFDWEYRAPRIRVAPRIRLHDYGHRNFDIHWDGRGALLDAELSEEARERIRERMEDVRERMDEARERMQESRERALERSQELRERMLERSQELRERALERSQEQRERALERREELRRRLDDRLSDRMLRRDRYRGI